jgi:hypothetical protein
MSDRAPLTDIFGNADGSPDDDDEEEEDVVD